MFPAALLVLCLLAPPAVKPTAEHTRFAGPLRADGSIDYEAAVNAKLAEDVTPENNANALLIQVFGPKPSQHQLPAEYFRRLGVAAPAEEKRLRGYHTDLEAIPTLDAESRQELLARAARLTNRPWKPADEPTVAAWLAGQAAPLDLTAKAVKRPKYYNPLVTTPEANGDPGLLIGALLPTAHASRDVATALATRAMLRLGAGDHAAAWADILAGFRLARHVATGGTLIEHLTGIALDTLMASAALAFAEHAKLTPAELAACRRDLAALPPFPTPAHCMDVEQRAMFLDCLDSVTRGVALGIAGNKKGAEAEFARVFLKSLDWNRTRAKANAFYDRVADAMREPDPAKRRAALAAAELRLRQSDNTRLAAEFAVSLYVGRTGGRQVAEYIGNKLLALLQPAFAKVQASADRTTQQRRHLSIAFALAAYRLDAGSYPAALADLAPKYLAEVPDDLFAGGPSGYKRTDAGYELTGVGQPGNARPTLDRVVTMPRPVGDE